MLAMFLSFDLQFALSLLFFELLELLMVHFSAYGTTPSGPTILGWSQFLGKEDFRHILPREMFYYYNNAYYFYSKFGILLGIGMLRFHKLFPIACILVICPHRRAYFDHCIELEHLVPLFDFCLLLQFYIKPPPNNCLTNANQHSL